MDEKTYIETGMAEVYKRALDNALKWQVDEDSMSAQPTSSIRILVRYQDKGPGSAEWRKVVITNPVGAGITFFDHPNSPIARLAPFEVSGGDDPQSRSAIREVSA